MSAEARWSTVPPPMVEPLEGHWKHFDDSMNALSFGFVATAILISMFLFLAIFEKFLRQRPADESSAQNPVDLEGQMGFGRKLENPSPKLDDHVWQRCISVDAWRANSYIHCTSCTCAMSPRAHFMANPT